MPIETAVDGMCLANSGYRDICGGFSIKEAS
jgi:hypothetical protein